LQAAAAALQELERLEQMRVTTPAVLDTLRGEYSERAATAEQELGKLTCGGDLQRQDLRRVRRHLLDVERSRVLEAFEHGTLTRDSQHRLLADIDARELELTQPTRANDA
jgi:hypothetical protein